MKKSKVQSWLMVVGLGSAAAALAEGPVTREYSREGEVSVGASAPSQDAMMRAIQNGSPTQLRATLEYGERVVCETCVPLLEAKLLDSDDPGVREMSAWWLRRQPFAAPMLLRSLKTTLVNARAGDTKRARAAEALGEFMDPHAFAPLADALREDGSAEVRASAVRALARLNHGATGPLIGDALGDKAVSVRLSALEVVLGVQSFNEPEALVERLSDADTTVRQRAARLCGEFRIEAARSPLIALLADDASAPVRKAAAWALGRIGGEGVVAAFTAAQAEEEDEGVLDAIRVAQRM